MAQAPSGCGCADIPEGDCDCDGNQLDAIGACSGDYGRRDAASIMTTWTTAWAPMALHTNGPGAIYDCGCADIPDGDCDCDGNQLDALGVCGGDCTADVDERHLR